MKRHRGQGYDNFCGHSVLVRESLLAPFFEEPFLDFLGEDLRL